MYSVDEASRLLGLDPSQVRRLLRSGEIKGKKLARDWVVLELDYKRKRKPKGGRKVSHVMLRCPSCKYVKPGYPDAKSLSQAKGYKEACPNCEDENIHVDMEVVEVSESRKVVWRDPSWVKEEANLVREIDDLGKKDNNRK